VPADIWENDLTVMHVADPVFGIQLGQRPVLVHARHKCAGRGIPCCIHDPSGHHMVTWPMNWRADTYVMERICPHGIGHPDPDHMAYVRSLTPEHERSRNEDDGCPYPHLEWQGTHGCDLCCRAPE
jgi:hypothetical protein